MDWSLCRLPARAAVHSRRRRQVHRLCPNSSFGTILDPRRKEAALAVVAAWLAFMIVLAVDGTVDGPTSFRIAGAVGAVIVVLGFAAASRCRLLPQRSNRHVAPLVLLSLAVGAGSEIHLARRAAGLGLLALGAPARDPLSQCRECRAHGPPMECFLTPLIWVLDRHSA
jgi:hypothetical protein